MEDLHLNVQLLRARVPNLTIAARAAGLRPATVSNLCTGKIPVGRAEVRTLVQLAALAGCTLDELIIRGSTYGVIETGIKTIDLLSPLVRGGIAGLVSRPGVGQLATVAELLYRLRRIGYRTLYRRSEQQAAGLADVLDQADVVYDFPADAAAEIRTRAASREPIVLAADRELVSSGELQRLRELVAEEGLPPFTVLLFDASGEAADEELPFGPLDTYLKFDSDLAARRLYPPVDPVASTSVILEGAQLEPLHTAIQQRARKTLRRYREWRPLVEARGFDTLPEGERAAYTRGARLEAYLSQPYYIAEPYTGKPGAWLTLHETLEDVRRILEGDADDTAPEMIAFTGRLRLSKDEGGAENGSL